MTGLLVTLAGMRLPRRALMDAVRRNPAIDELLGESSVAEEFIERGIEQGPRKSVRLALQGRFGTLDPALLAAIERADEAALERTLLRAASGTPEELRAGLGLSQ